MDIIFHFPEKFDEDKSVITSFKEILTHPRISGFNIYYSEENIKQFTDYNSETDVYLVAEKKIIRQFLHSKRSKKLTVGSSETQYLQWNLDEFQTSVCCESLIKIAEQIYLDNSYKYILVNLDNSIKTCRNKILIFRDCKRYNYPDFFIKIDFIVNSVEFYEWIKTNHVVNFSLRNELLFQKISSITIKGATLYLEIAEKRYWHLDTFHDYIEYEIYDNIGNHIATANKDGELNFEGRKSDRSLPL